jgi:hypothetical protein
MVKKISKNRSRKNARKIARRRTRKMVGGNFSQQNLQQLLNYGFSRYQIESLNELGVTFNEIQQRINSIINQDDTGFNGNSDDLTEQVMVELLNERIFGNRNNEVDHQINNEYLAPIARGDEEHYMDMDTDELNLSNDEDSLHLSDLNLSRNSMDSNTTSPSESLNISEISDSTLPSDFSENESFASEVGGKRKTRKSKKSIKRNRKTRKQRGGTCYGTGVGANRYDPNFSVYNTNMLKLFPYKS